MTEVGSVKGKTPRIGKYEIVRKIGEGGLAEIFLAQQRSLSRMVAIKILHRKITKRSDLVERFQRESVTLAKMSHPNIVHVIDRGEDSGRLYFAMEYIEGTNFKEFIRSSDWKLEGKLEILIQVLKALDYAHKNGVIHRDIKPANILIDRQKNALIADFGIAQLLEPGNYERTETGTVMGTYAYMSPEQKEDSRNVDHTTDIYAVGVMLYEVLTGKKPMGRFKLPSEINPDLPKGYDHIITKALAQNRADRYQKAVAFKDELLAVMHRPDEYSSAIAQQESKAKNFVGNCSFLDTLRDSPYSSTYLVEDRTSRSLYVIKKQNKPDVGLKEAKLLSNLSHPNILSIHGAGGDANKLVIVMDYAQGGSLADRMVKPFSWREAVKIMNQIVAGIDFAHRNNIVHGNLKPSNILLSGEDVVKIADFALIAHYDKKATNYYAAPERRKSKLADIYSAGVIFYQLLTNRLPTTDTAGKFVWIDSHRSIPTKLKSLVERMLRNVPSNRISSFAEVQDILCHLDGTAPIKVVSAEGSGRRDSYRLLLIWGTLFIITAILILLYVIGVFT